MRPYVTNYALRLKASRRWRGARRQFPGVQFLGIRSSSLHFEHLFYHSGDGREVILEVSQKSWSQLMGPRDGFRVPVWNDENEADVLKPMADGESLH